MSYLIEKLLVRTLSPLAVNSGSLLMSDTFRAFLDITNIWITSWGTFIKAPVSPGTDDSYALAVEDGTFYFKTYGPYHTNGTIRIYINDTVVKTLSTTTPDSHWVSGATSEPVVTTSVAITAGDIIRISFDSGTEEFIGMTFNVADSTFFIPKRYYDTAPTVYAGYP